MKKFISALLFAGAVAWVSCGGSPKQPAGSEQGKRSATHTKVLTKAEFLQKIVDFETSPNEWNYLGDKPAIIDFYADWCGPCQALAPILEALAAEYEGRIDVYKVNTDKEKALASAFGIKTIPFLLFIPMNGPPQKAEGIIPKAGIKEVIESILLKE